MEQKIDNQLEYCNMEKYIGGNEINNYNITIYQESEREFVVTHNANIKPVSYFTGRELELQELRQRIEEGRKSVLVSGMGGIGKTQICRELFNEYYNRQMKDKKGEFRHIGYIEYDGDMGSSLVKCLRYKEQADPKLNQEAAWKELEDLALKGKLLLFIDNVNKSMSEDTGLQRLNHIPCAVIITSRQVFFSDEFELYKIDFLNKEQCKEIYEKIRFRNSGSKVKPEEVQDLEYIIENLVGKHTITVQLLANLARAKVWGVKKLKEELELKGFKLQFHKNGKLINIQKSYEVLYNLSGLTEAEQNILEAFSVFPYISLAAETCNQWLLADAGVSEDDDILTGLYEKGWLQFDMEHESYSLHPIFAEFICEKCKPKAENHVYMMKLFENDAEELINYNALELPVLVLISESISKKIVMRNNHGLSDFVFDFIFLLIYLGRYEKAEQWCKNILNVYEEELEKNYKYKARIYWKLAQVYECKRDFPNAKMFYIKSRMIYEKELGENHYETALIYIGLASIYIFEEKYGKAAELYRKSIRIYERERGENHPETILCYKYLADMYVRQGFHLKAVELYSKCLSIYEKDIENNYPEMISIYNDLANIYLNNKLDEKAEKMYKDSLKLSERGFNESFIGMLNSYRGLADINLKRKNYEKALDYCFKSYMICILKLGLEQQQTLIVYLTMKTVYFKWKPESNFDQWLENKLKKFD